MQWTFLWILRWTAGYHTTISDIAEAGANVFVAGSAIYGSNDYQETITSLKKLAEAGAARYR